MALSVRTVESACQGDVTRRTAVLVWLSFTAFAVAIVGLIVAAPLMKEAGYQQIAAAIYSTFSHVCHQIPERSFHLAGHKFGVCSRCTGLYSGIAVAALAYPLMRPLRLPGTPRLIWLVLAAIPIAVDFSLGYFNIWHNTHLSRFVTGALLGSVTIFYILPGLIELSLVFTRLLKRQNSSPITTRY